MCYGSFEVRLLNLSAKCTLVYGPNKEMIRNTDIIDSLGVSIFFCLKKRGKKLKNINDLLASLCVGGNLWDDVLDPNLFCKAIKERIDASKNKLEKATRKELKRWDVYFFRDGRWNKCGRFDRVLRSGYGLWGIDAKNKMDILLDGVLAMKKRRNPRRGAFYAPRIE